jgi:hypothetical protein
MFLFLALFTFSVNVLQIYVFIHDSFCFSSVSGTFGFYWNRCFVSRLPVSYEVCLSFYNILVFIFKEMFCCCNTCFLYYFYSCCSCMNSSFFVFYLVVSTTARSCKNCFGFLRKNYFRRFLCCCCYGCFSGAQRFCSQFLLSYFHRICYCF